MKTQHVVVRDVNGNALLKLAVDARGETVFVTSEVEYARMQKGQSELLPIGFPVHDVFLYDGREIASEVECEWETLHPWPVIQ